MKTKLHTAQIKSSQLSSSALRQLSQTALRTVVGGNGQSMKNTNNLCS